jgi:hypothetical protein
MKIENRQRLLAIVAGAALGLLITDKLIVGPLVQGWKQRAAQIIDLRKSIAQGSQVLEREDRIRERWESMRTNTLPENVSEAENEVLRGFERWSEESLIGVSSIKQQWKRAGEDYLTLECRADASGSIQELAHFLYLVEKDPLALKVEAMEITARDESGRQLSLALQVSGLQLNPQAR